MKKKKEKRKKEDEIKFYFNLFIKNRKKWRMIINRRK